MMTASNEAAMMRSAKVRRAAETLRLVKVTAPSEADMASGTQHISGMFVSLNWVQGYGSSMITAGMIPAAVNSRSR